MKRVHFFLFCLSLIGLAACDVSEKNDRFRSEGVISGGGGLGVRMEKTGEVQAMDLHEGYLQRCFLYPEKLTQEEIIQKAMRRLQKLNSEQLPVDRVRHHLEMLPGKIRWQKQALPLAHDYSKLGVVGGELVQVAYFDDESEVVHIDRDLWEQTSDLHRVALYLHEAIYKTLRETTKLTSSSPVRGIVAGLLAESFDEPPSLKEVRDGKTLCHLASADRPHSLVPDPDPYVPVSGPRLVCRNNQSASGFVDPNLRYEFDVQVLEGGRVRLTYRVAGGFPCFGACWSERRQSQDFPGSTVEYDPQRALDRYFVSVSAEDDAFWLSFANLQQRGFESLSTINTAKGLVFIRKQSSNQMYDFGYYVGENALAAGSLGSLECRRVLE